VSYLDSKVALDIGKIGNPAFVIQRGTFLATEDASGSFPRRNFVDISHTEAAMT
jgi:hypothetical protein